MNKMKTWHWLAIGGGALLLVGGGVYFATRKSKETKAIGVVPTVAPENANNVDEAINWINNDVNRSLAMYDIGKKMLTGNYDESSFTADEVKNYINKYVLIKGDADKTGQSLKDTAKSHSIWGYFNWGAGKDLTNDEKISLRNKVETKMSYKKPTIGGVSLNIREAKAKSTVSKAISEGRFATALADQLKDIYSID